MIDFIFKEYGRVSFKSESRGSKGGGGSTNGSSYAQKEERAAMSRRGAELLAAKSDTEYGMTPNQSLLLKEFEANIRTAPVEHLRIAHDNGYRKDNRGGAHSVSIPSHVYEDKDFFVTHNHPSGNGAKSLSERVGSPFSANDLATLGTRETFSGTREGYKGIRAVGETFTYHISRTPQSKPFSEAQVKKEWNKEVIKALKRYVPSSTARSWKGSKSVEALIEYAKKGNSEAEYSQRWHRIQAVIFHQAIRNIANKYGLKYTRSFR